MALRITDPGSRERVPAAIRAADGAGAAPSRGGIGEVEVRSAEGGRTPAKGILEILVTRIQPVARREGGSADGSDERAGCHRCEVRHDGHGRGLVLAGHAPSQDETEAGKGQSAQAAVGGLSGEHGAAHGV